MKVAASGKCRADRAAQPREQVDRAGVRHQRCHADHRQNAQTD